MPRNIKNGYLFMLYDELLILCWSIRSITTHFFVTIKTQLSEYLEIQFQLKLCFVA